MKTVSSDLSLNLTRNQQEILSCLRSAARPLGGYAILDRVRAGGILYPASVYRALDHLMRLGLVHRILSLDSFVACKHPHRDHQTGFLICSLCQKVVEMPLGSGQEARLKALFQEEIKIERLVSLEFAGRCSACSSVATKAKRRSRNSNARHEGGRVAAE